MTIHNLHKKHIQQTAKTYFFVLFLLFSYFFSFAQDSITLEAGIKEKKLVEFEQKFFDAITNKAINNHQKAIEDLEECNSIMPENKAVLFELSKNYLSLNKLPEAEEYANQALAIDNENIWLLEHLVSVFKKQRNFNKAIEVQLKIGEKNPKKQIPLVYLYLQKGDRKKAKKLLQKLADAKLLNSRLLTLKTQLNQKRVKPTVAKKTIPTNENTDLKVLFKEKKSYKVLSKLLSQLDEKNDRDLLSFSEQGISLFPAQPFVYLMNGKALNKEKEHKKAIESLQNGIDFVIDDTQLENQFYSEIVKAYKAIGDAKNANKYQKKIK